MMRGQKEAKHFFFEKKKQKTSENQAAMVKQSSANI
jgi:hypothetical protein